MQLKAIEESIIDIVCRQTIREGYFLRKHIYNVLIITYLDSREIKIGNKVNVMNGKIIYFFV